MALTCHAAMSHPHRKAPIAPSPSSAKALLKASELQAATPPMAPNPGPMPLSMKKYVPPAFGMAVISSAFVNTLGTSKTAASA